MTREPLNLDGYTDVPDGKIASVVTFLEMTEKAALKPVEQPDVALLRMDEPDIDWYRTLFRRIGTDWMWFSRLAMADNEVVGILNDPRVEVHVLARQSCQQGLLELDFRDPQNVELAYFGLVPEAIGSGLGRWLMNEAIEKVWSRPETRRLSVHTCTLDGPMALDFYRRSGFVPYKRSIEIVDDPRLSGMLPRSAAPQHPLIV
ncbi:MAG: GNAT family N-acetyltransferase [Stappiaceae bacterium]